jgi:2-amino-4-hydroxy-6-hydroxymethyldihydropteridine diphosphokinase
MSYLYAIALGSNRRHGRYGEPGAVLAAALVELASQDLRVVAASRVIRSEAVGPAGRGFANAAVIVETTLMPPALLDRVKAIERGFGRRRGRRWGARVLDLDLVLWSGGTWPPAPRAALAGRLAIPHAALHLRAFVLDPLAGIAAAWPDPPAIRRLRHRLTRAERLPR